MLFGEYFHQVDQKGRVRIPAKLKIGLGENFLVTKGTNSCLFVFSKETLETSLFSKLENVPLSDSSSSLPLRMLFSSASELDEDNQGRSLLPKNLRDFAKIKKDIVFLGVGNRAEIWAKEEYDRYINGVDFDNAMEELQKHGV
ncbi:MAG: division/cell wall cluster transcriptional repressor MraZ [Firmicutes bacterium]|nr:division/cell wall cluster transcriptional repressor MraZ [Bacillota bacterium]